MSNSPPPTTSSSPRLAEMEPRVLLSSGILTVDLEATSEEFGSPEIQKFWTGREHEAGGEWPLLFTIGRSHRVPHWHISTRSFAS